MLPLRSQRARQWTQQPPPQQGSRLRHLRLSGIVRSIRTPRRRTPPLREGVNTTDAALMAANSSSAERSEGENYTVKLVRAAAAAIILIAAIAGSTSASQPQYGGLDQLPCETGAHWVVVHLDESIPTLVVDGTQATFIKAVGNVAHYETGPVGTDPDISVDLTGDERLNLSHCIEAEATPTPEVTPTPTPEVTPTPTPEVTPTPTPET